MQITMLSQSQRPINLWVLLASKLITSAFSIFFLIFLIGEGIPDFIKTGDPILLILLPLFFITIATFIVSFLLPKPSIYICMFGGIGLLLEEVIRGNIMLGLLFGTPYIVYAIIYLSFIKTDI